MVMTTWENSTWQTGISTQKVSLAHVMGLLSFMFLAMAFGALLVPPTLYFPAIILEFILLFAISLTNRKESNPAMGITGFLALVFSACTGAVLSPTIQYLMHTPNGTAVIIQATLVTFGVFALFGLYGVLTHRNLSILSKFLIVGLFILLGVLIFSLFFQSFFSQFNPIIDIAGVVLFSLFTAVDFQRAKRVNSQDIVLVTLDIFLDFVNLLTFILRIFLRNR